MKVAIIEEDPERLNTMGELTSEFPWHIDFFNSPRDFGHADLGSYDVVVADCSLSTMDGRELIRSIERKSHAEMFLMSDSTGVFSEEDIENETIKGFIEKGSPESLIDHLKYIDSKIRISRLMQLEAEKLKGILANGHTFEVKEDLGILEIREFPTARSMENMLEEIKDSGVKKLLVSFTGGQPVASAHLGVLVSLYKSVKAFGCKMAFWTSDEHVEQMMKDCNLDNLYPIFNSLEGALNNLLDYSHASD